MIAEAVRAVLQMLDEQGEADYTDWIDQVQASMVTLEASYKELRNVNRDLIDYSELPAQAAYLYRYVIGHADFVYQILKRAREAAGRPLFPSGYVWLTSVGGGPGSDLLGVLKYLIDNDDEPDIDGVSYTVIDKEKNWQHVIECFCAHFANDIDINVIYQTCDLSAANLPAAVTLKDEHIVVMSFFISEVCAIPNGQKVIANVNNLLKDMKNRAILIYNDSSAYSFYSFFQNRVDAARNFNELIDVREELRAESPAYDGIFEEYAAQYNYGFKLSGNMVAKVLRKEIP
jgi:hypothetical protein